MSLKDLAYRKISLTEIERKDAEIERLTAALKSCPCPGGGFNGMPADAEATVGLCLAHGVCGCVYGSALEQARKG